MDLPARDSYDLATGLRHRLSDAEPSTYVSMESQLRRAVYERLEESGRDRRSPRRRRPFRRA